MKTPQKIQKAPAKKANRQPSQASLKGVNLAHAARPGLRHFRLVEHKHTGKLIHYRHTSHLALLILLLIVGIFMFFTAGFARVQADQTTGSGAVSVGVVVPGPAPVVGAAITSPAAGLKLTDQNTVDVIGTCQKGTFVVIQNNGELAGSTVCTDAGIFRLQIQLQAGENVLSALNYDNLNQPGPNTPFISIRLTMTTPLAPVSKLDTPIVLPLIPSIAPNLGDETASCSRETAQDLPIGGSPRVAVVCIPRFIETGTEYVLGIMAWGGTPPYAVDVNWGDESESNLFSIASQGTRTVKFNYASAGVYTIKLKLKDKDGRLAIVQTAVQASGVTKAPIVQLTESILATSWFKTPVPLYLIAVAMTLGFWGGDIFDRNFGARRRQSSRRKAA